MRDLIEWWWLRSPGNNPHNAAIVNHNGNVNDNGNNVNNNNVAVRPAPAEVQKSSSKGSRSVIQTEESDSFLLPTKTCKDIKRLAKTWFIASGKTHWRRRS